MSRDLDLFVISIKPNSSKHLLIISSSISMCVAFNLYEHASVADFVADELLQLHTCVHVCLVTSVLVCESVWLSECV